MPPAYDRAPRKKRKAVKPAVKDTKGASEFKKAKTFKKTPVYRKAVREAYDANPPKAKAKRYQAAIRQDTPEARVIRKTKTDRQNRRNEIARGTAKKDTKGNAELYRGRSVTKTDEYFSAARKARHERYKRSSPAVQKKMFGDPAKDTHSAATIKANTPGQNHRNQLRLEKYKKDEHRAGNINYRKNILPELEGRGKLVKGSKKLARKISSTLGGRGGSKYQLAALTPTGVAKSPLGKVRPAKTATNFVEDMVNFPAQAVPSAWNTVAAAKEAADGDKTRAKGLIKDFKKNDAIYNAAAGTVDKVSGDSKNAKKHFRRARKSAADHPGFLTLEVVGTKGMSGRALGRGIRGTGRVVEHTGKATHAPALVAKGKAIHRVADPHTRTDKVLPNSNVRIKREYSRDVIKKGRQVAVEKTRRRVSKHHRTKAENATDVETTTKHVKKSRRWDPDRVTSTDLRRRADEREAVTEDVRRVEARRTDKETAPIYKEAKKHGAAFSVIGQNITKATHEDLAAYHRELTAVRESGKLDKADAHRNKTLTQLIEKALKKSTPEDLKRIETLARKYEAQQRPKQQRLSDNKLVPQEAVDIAAEVPYAAREMGAHRDPEPALTESGVRVLVAEGKRHKAATAEMEAHAASVKTKAALDRTHAEARVSAAKTHSSQTLLSAYKARRKAATRLRVLTRRADVKTAGKAGVARTRIKPAERALLRSDKRYSKAENALAIVNGQKAEFRAEARIARRSRDAERIAEADTNLAESSELAAALAEKLDGIRTELLTGPLVKDGKLAPRAKVKRKERKVVAAKAESKPSKWVLQAKADLKEKDRAIAAERARLRGVKAIPDEGTKRSPKGTVKDGGRPSVVDRLLRDIDEHDKAASRLEEARTEHRGAAQPLFDPETGEPVLTEAGNPKMARKGGAKARHILVKNEEAGKLQTEKNVLRDSTGRKLTPEVIRSHRESVEDDPIGPAGTEPRRNGKPVFLTQAKNARGAKNFYMPGNRPADATGKSRGGGATVGGTFDADPAMLVEQARQTQSLLSADTGWKGLTNEFGYREDGATKITTFDTPEEATRHAENLNFDENGKERGGIKYRATRANPFAGSKAQMQEMIDSTENDPRLLGDAIVNGIRGEPASRGAIAHVTGERAPGNYILVPEPVMDQFTKHMRNLGPTDFVKMWSKGNQFFRSAVLSTSPSWLFGNVAEGALRAAVGGVGPRSLTTGIRVRKALKRQLITEFGEVTGQRRYDEFLARAVGGGHMAMQSKTNVRKGREQFDPDTRTGAAAEAMAKIAAAPGGKQLGQAYDVWTSLVFDRINKPIESTIQTGMLGRELRQGDLMSGEMLKMGQKAVEQAAQGLKDTNEQAHYGRLVDRMYGRYGKFSPEKRAAIALYTPFVAWTLNAYRFVYDVLPRDHPALTSLTVAMEQANREWLEDNNLNQFIEGHLPGFLQGTIPMSGGRHRPASRYTPFGAFTDPLGTVAGAVLPQGQGVLAAMRGTDWKGKKLTKKDGSEADTIDRGKAALGAWVGSMIPFYVFGARAKKSIKDPKTLNPINPIKPPKSSSRGPKKGYVVGGRAGQQGYVIGGSGSSKGYVVP